MNLFDAGIVMLSLVEAIFLSGGKTKAVSAFRAIRLFRTFRVLRVTKLLRSLSYMKIIIGVIIRSLKKFAYIAVLLFLFLFIFTLLGMNIFGGAFNFPDNIGPNRLRENFDTFGDAFITSFQIMTQENWQEVLFLALRSKTNNIISLLFLISWIFIGNYIFLNLFLAILLDEFTGEEVAEDLEEIMENEEDEEVYGVGSTFTRTHGGTEAKRAFSHKTPSLDSGTGNLNRKFSEDDDTSKALSTQKHEIVHCKKALFLLSEENLLRKICLKILRHRHFEKSVLVVIVLTSIKLALDTYVNGGTLQTVSTWVDIGFNVFFFIEAFVKIVSLGFIFDKGTYLRDSWNMLDFIIVVASLLDLSLAEVHLNFIKVIFILLYLTNQ